MQEQTATISGRGYVIFLAAVFAYLYLAFFLLPATPIFKEGDYLIHMNNAARMLDGEVIYRDFIQVVYPGTEAWYALFIRLVGPSIAIANWSVLIIGLSLAVVSLKISALVLNGPFRYVPAAIYLAFGFFWFGADPSHRLFSLVLVIAALYLILKSRSPRIVFAAGFLCGLSSAFTQPRGLAGVAAISLFFVWQKIRREIDLSESARLVAVLALGFGVPVIAISGYLYFQSGNDFVYYTTAFLGRYRVHRQNNYGSYVTELTALVDERNPVTALLKVFYLVLLPISFAGFWLWRRSKRDLLGSEQDSRLMLIGLFALCLVLTNFAPTAVRMYHVALPMLILAVYMCADAVRHRPAASQLVLAALVLFAVVQVVRVQLDSRHVYASLPAGKVAFSPGLDPERYLWLAANTRPGDPFFESYTRTYFPLLLKNPTRLPMIYDTPYTSPEEIAEAVAVLKREKPRYILWDGLWSKPASERVEGDNLGPFYEFLTDEYALRLDPADYDLQDFEIWERRSPQQQ